MHLPNKFHKRMLMDKIGYGLPLVISMEVIFS